MGRGFNVKRIQSKLEASRFLPTPVMAGHAKVTACMSISLTCKLHVEMQVRT
jgi:hypothetical protein